jgi:quinol monooxygenase YgiN
MALRHRLALAIALMLSAITGSASAQAPTPGGTASPSPSTGPVYIVTYFEVGAAAAGKTVGLLQQFAMATRKEDGNAGFLALEELARPARFAMVEVWRDKAALDAHGAAVAALRDKLQPLFASPFDIRSNSGLSVAGPAIGDEPRSLKPVYVLTHVDVFPAGKDQTIELLKQLAEASRKEAGNLRFDVLQQDGRANHLPLVEAWRDGDAQRMHAMAEHTRAFRAKLVPLQGALYDERLYALIR